MSREVHSPSLKVKYLYKLFRIVLHGGFPFSLYLLLYSLIYYISMDSWIFAFYFKV